MIHEFKFKIPDASVYSDDVDVYYITIEKNKISVPLADSGGAQDFESLIEGALNPQYPNLKAHAHDSSFLVTPQNAENPRIKEALRNGRNVSIRLAQTTRAAAKKLK